MRIKHLLFPNLALLLSPCAAMAGVPVEEVGYTMERTVVLTMEAADGHPYRVLVAWPETPPPPAGWPILYVLDGNDNFAVATETARRLARARARNGVEPGLIVAIESGTLPRRVLDYTPATAGYAIPVGLPAHGLKTGGADAFLDFVSDRLQPFIAKRWQVDNGRATLMGHSFGGVIALHALFTRPAMFSGYVAVSPSLWFGEDLLYREERHFKATGTISTDHKPRLLITMGNDERGPNAQVGAAAEALVARLSSQGVAARYLSLSGQGHGTTMLATMGEAVATAFGTGTLQ